MRRTSLTILVLGLAAGVADIRSPASAAAAQRSGTTVAGVPISLEGRTARITVPKTTRRGRQIVVRCGRLTTADLLPAGRGFERTSVARAARVFRGHRRMTLRLSHDVSATAEWCTFDTLPSGRSGAAVLKPRVAPRPAPLVGGPGVREATTETGSARFLLNASTLTLRTDKPLPGDIVLLLACYIANDKGGLEGLRILGARAVATGHRRHAMTVDLGRDIEGAANLCLAEDSSGGGSDLYLADFKP